MPLNPLVTLGSLAAAAIVLVGGTGLSGLFVGPAGNAIPIAETAILAPGSFMHPRPGEFLKENHPASAPLILVEVQHPVEIMKYQVSALEYERCVKAAACAPVDKPGRGDQSVTGVSHIDAEAYAAWYSHATGQTWRLPSDEEWAYAAAERFTADIEGGQSDPDNPAVHWLANYRTEAALGRRSDPAPRTRGSFGVNSKGVADTAGNVWEWTSTCYVHAIVARDGTSIESAIDNCGVSVVEGFHRTYMSNFIRDGKSGGCAVGTPPDNLGFRLVRDRPSFVKAVMRRFGIS